MGLLRVPSCPSWFKIFKLHHHRILPNMPEQNCSDPSALKVDSEMNEIPRI